MNIKLNQPGKPEDACIIHNNKNTNDTAKDTAHDITKTLMTPHNTINTINDTAQYTNDTAKKQKILQNTKKNTNNTANTRHTINTINTTKKYPIISSAEFKQLPYKEKIYLTKQYLFEKQTYQTLTGIKEKDEQELKVEQKLKELQAYGAFELPKKERYEKSFRIISGHWAAYRIYLNKKLIVDQLRSIPYGICCDSFFSIPLMTLPILRCDLIVYALLDVMLESEYYARASGVDVLIDAMLARAMMIEDKVSLKDVQMHSNNTKKENILIKENVTKNYLQKCRIKYSGYKTIQAIQEDVTKLFEPDNLFDDLLRELLVIHWKPMLYQDNIYLPMIPRELIEDRFNVKEWAMLL